MCETNPKSQSTKRIAMMAQIKLVKVHLRIKDFDCQRHYIADIIYHGVKHAEEDEMAVALPETWQPPRSLDSAELADPVQSARAAGLRYASDLSAGIRRKRVGKAFSYLDADGGLVRDKEVIRRIKRLAIPPAWTDVWICPDPRGHLQATGRDARGRKQYRYHARWREVRDAVKYDRMLAFAQVLPKIRERSDRDLERSGMPREKVLAAIVRLLEETRIRAAK